MDLNAIFQKQMLLFEKFGIKPFDNNYKFYFDETNNIRKFSLNPSNTSRVNNEEALFSDFILGGICFKIAPDYEELFRNLKLQATVKELKSKHLFPNNNFQNDFGGDRVTTLLKWFDNNQDVYLHYTIENNLYFALVDIVDSLFDKYPQMISFHIELKDALYRVCKIYQEEVLELLCLYEYPNISQSQLREFAINISKIIDDADVRDDFFTEFLRQMLKSVNESIDMPFIVENEPFILQDGYYSLYFNRMVTFKDSALVFDEEKEVIEILNKTNSLSDLINCSFVDSTTNKFIQISDCVIACLSKTFKFLDGIEKSNISNLEISVNLRNNLRRLKALMDRSDAKNRLLIHNLNAQSLTQERYEKLSIICGKLY